MLRSRWLSTFTVIGVLLIALGVTGLILGHRFIFDPGQRSTGNEAWYYLAIGIFMLLNGLMTPVPPEEKRPPKKQQPSLPSQNGSVIGGGSIQSREAALSAIDKTDE